MSVIAVIDYDMGNLHSVCKGLEKAGATPKVTDLATEIHQADAVVLPGVGAFDRAVEHIRSRNLEEPIKEVIASGKPFLGICLGLQILFDYSEEGQQPGLGILPGAVRRFHWEPGITIPHMGWNHLHFTQPDIPLWAHLSTTSWMYFVHSYYVDPQDKAVCGATVTHGTQCVAAAIAKNNLMAVQFHPEKSDRAGLQILSNFVEHVRSQSPICV